MTPRTRQKLPPLWWWHPEWVEIFSEVVICTMFVCVCFKGSPLCLTKMSVFTEDPQSREFPLHHYSGLGTQTVPPTSKWYHVVFTLPRNDLLSCLYWGGIGLNENKLK